MTVEEELELKLVLSQMAAQKPVLRVEEDRRAHIKYVNLLVPRPFCSPLGLVMTNEHYREHMGIRHLT